jgi:multiple sugar transport system permease protein
MTATSSGPATTGSPATTPRGGADVRSTDRGTSSARAFDIVCLVILLVFVVLWVLPTLWAINTSFKTNATAALGAGEILADTGWTAASYADLLSRGSLTTWMLSSAIISLTVVALTVLFASLAAYALSRLQFRGKNVVLGVILAGLMIPPQVLIVPWFREFGGLGLLNTYWAVILPAVPQVVAVFVFKQFFDGLPKEIEESARIDGASYWTIYRVLIMPLSRSAVSAVAIFTLVVTWNDLLWPLVALTNPDIMTVPVGLATVGGTFQQNYADTMAAAILGALPLLLLFLFFQRRIVEGIAGTGLKG